MAEIVWADEAVANLELIVDYIRLFDPRAADRMASRLVDATETLRMFPHRGRPIGAGRRELPSVPPYVIRYRVDGDVVAILRIRHGARAPALD